MAQDERNGSPGSTQHHTGRTAGPDTPPRVVPRRRYGRVLVPVGIVALAAGGFGLAPALASAGDPDLPDITAEKLIAKMAASETEAMSGTVKSEVDLGLPDVGGMAGGSPSAGGDGKGPDGEGSSADPQGKLLGLATGDSTVKVAMDGPEKQSVSLLDSGAEYRMVHNGDEVWAYDSRSNEVWHATDKDAAKKDAGKDGKDKGFAFDGKDAPKTPQEFAEKVIETSGEHTEIKVDGTSEVAGRDAHDLTLTPKGSGSTIGEIRIAVDAKTGVPLKVTVEARSGGKPVADIGFTEVDFGKPDAKRFAFTPPAGAKVTEADDAAKADKGEAKDKAKGKAKPGAGKGAEGIDENDTKVFGEGWTSVARLALPKGALDEKATGKEAEELKKNDVPDSLGGIADLLGSEVKGDFGSGTVIKSRVVNALVTDDGKVYVGAVSTGNLIKAADQDAKG